MKVSLCYLCIIYLFSGPLQSLFIIDIDIKKEPSQIVHYSFCLNLLYMQQAYVPHICLPIGGVCCNFMKRNMILLVFSQKHASLRFNLMKIPLKLLIHLVFRRWFHPMKWERCCQMILHNISVRLLAIIWDCSKKMYNLVVFRTSMWTTLMQKHKTLMGLVGLKTFIQNHYYKLLKRAWKKRPRWIEILIIIYASL